MTGHAAECPDRIRLAFVVTSLTLGGAEMMLWKLLSRIDRSRFDPLVVALSRQADPDLRQRFDRIGVECRCLGLDSRFDAIAGLPRLVKLLRGLRPHIVQGWMYHGNLAATLAVLPANARPPVLWNVRCTLLAEQKPMSSFIAWLGGKLSFLPRRIINNSVASALEHEREFGYRVSKRVILPNGFDTAAFGPSEDARITLRRSLNVSPDAVLVSLFGRYHPMKDHANFLRAASIVSRTHPETRYVLAGEGVDCENAALTGLVRDCGVIQCVHLLGLRNDMERLTAGLDIAVSASGSGEGFPNVVGEAMSCGVPCVVTDVGDSAWVVGDTGKIVPPREPEALARAIVELIEAGPAARKAFGMRARKRVEENFSLDAVVRRYETLYLEVRDEAIAERSR